MKMNKEKLKQWLNSIKECDIESKEEALWIYVMGGCGCGSSDELAKKAWKIFNHFATKIEERDIKYSIYNDSSDEIISHWLAFLELTEHGSGIGSSWLTEEGQEVYKAINEKFKH